MLVVSDPLYLREEFRALNYKRRIERASDHDLSGLYLLNKTAHSWCRFMLTLAAIAESKSSNSVEHRCEEVG
jgi:hypothetical protein